MVTPEPWWKEYRLRRSKPREVMSMELIIRTSFVQVLKEYKENCSIGGVKDISRSSGWKERFIRILIFGGTFATLCYFLYGTGVGILTKPLMVTMESSTYPIRDIDFPAVALCNVNRVSMKALKNAANKVYPKYAKNNESMEEMEEFCLNCGRFIDFSFDDDVPDKFLKISAIRNNTRRIIDYMKNMSPNCSEMLIRCSWDSKIVDCSSLFTVRRTARGHCCVFNYVLDYDSASGADSTIAEIRHQEFPGYLHGLSVIVDPLLEDYAYPINNVRGFDVLLFDPVHFADLSAGRISHRIAEPGYSSFLELKSIKQVAAPEVKKYPLSVRKCLFIDESPHFTKMYSYSGCIVRCKIKAVQSLCKCTPYFLPVAENEGRICTMDDLLCLNKHKDKLLYIYPENSESTEGLEVEIEDSIYCPECYPDCELTQHFITDYRVKISGMDSKKFYKDVFTTGINMTDKCMITIYHPDADSVLERLDVVSYWYEILSNIGGLAGVLMGISAISVVEIVYYLIVRFLIVLQINYTKYHL